MAYKQPRIATFCQALVKRYTDYDVNWVDFDRYRNTWSSMLISYSNPQTRYNENGKSVSAIELRNGLFLHVGIAFDYNSKSLLQSISIHFYDEERMLLRADWSYAELERGVHAQPHWHMSSTFKKSISTQSGSQSFSDFDKFEGFKSEETDVVESMIDISRIHLFMAYREGDTSLNFREKGVMEEWLTYTLRYMDEQFHLVRNHGER